MREWKNGGSPLNGAARVKMSSSLAAVERANHGDENNHKHYENIDAQAPQQQARAHGEFALAESRAGFCGDDLIGFEKRQNNIGILQIGMLRVGRRGTRVISLSAVFGFFLLQFSSSLS